MRTLIIMKSPDYNYLLKHLCKFLRITIRRKDEIYIALKWFGVMIFSIIPFSFLIMGMRILFGLVYSNGRYTFSMVFIKLGLDAADLVLTFLVAYAFGYLAVGTIKVNDEDL